MYDAISAGHVCLDMTPVFFKESGGIKDIFVGGKLTNIGEMKMTIGGSISNTGVALNKLGLNAPIMGKVGKDQIGGMISDIAASSGVNVNHMMESEGDSSSYTIVLAPYGVDRMFLHEPGANNTFTSDDVSDDILSNTKLFHFGYPTLMKKMYENCGAETVKLFKRAKEKGCTTSLDLTLPDPSSECGKLDWEAILSDLLPYTDVFLPSIEEIVYMLDKAEYGRLKAINDDILENISIEYISGLGNRIIDMGCRIVVLKCGTLGYYVKTAGKDTLKKMGRAIPSDLDQWADKELFSGIFKIDEVKSATGAGDTSIAAFLTSIIKGYSLEKAVTLACATGALCCTAYGSTEALMPIEDIWAKVESGWERRPVDRDTFDFRLNEEFGLYER